MSRRLAGRSRSVDRQLGKTGWLATVINLTRNGWCQQNGEVGWRPDKVGDVTEWTKEVHLTVEFI